MAASPDLHSLLLLAAEGPSPRGDNPSDAGGILIIVGIVLAVIVGAFVLHLLVHKASARRRGAAERKAHRERSVGRVGKQEGP